MLGFDPFTIIVIVIIVLGMLLFALSTIQSEEKHAASQQKLHAKRQERRNARVFDAEADDTACAACESTHLEFIDEGVYRCKDCGHTGGTRYPEWFKRKEREKIMVQSPQKRRRAAAGILRDVSLALTSLEGDIDIALEGSRLDTNILLDDTVLDHHGQDVKREAVYDIQEQLGRINHEVESAGLLLNEDLTELKVSADTTFMLSELYDRWTKHDSDYVRRHERVIEGHIEQLAFDVKSAKMAIMRKVGELSKGPKPRRKPPRREPAGE